MGGRGRVGETIVRVVTINGQVGAKIVELVYEAAKLLASNSQQIVWSLNGVSPGAYSYSGAYVNRDPATQPLSFDQVGLLGGAGLFNSASTSDANSFTNLTVTLVKGKEAQ